MKSNKKNKRLFSTALFKQSCKANGIMWAIITIAVCFMLACVMLISGTSSISEVKDGVQNTIIEELITSYVKKSAVNLYDSSNDAEYIFDQAFSEKFNELNTESNYESFIAISNDATTNATELITKLVKEKVTAETTSRITSEITSQVESEADEIKAEIAANVATDMATSEAQEKIATYVNNGYTLEEATNLVIAEYTESETETVTNKHIAAATESINTSEHQTEVANEVLSENEATYIAEAKEELAEELAEIEETATEDATTYFTNTYVTPSYLYAIEAVKEAYPESDNATIYGAAMVTINPNNLLDDEYSTNGEDIPEEFINDLLPYMKEDVYSLSSSKTTTLSIYIESDERFEFRHERAYNANSMLIAAKMNDSTYKQENILSLLANYNVDEATYDAMGFTYDNVNKICHEAMLEYQEMYDYEISLLSDEIKNDETLYKEACEEIHDNLYLSVAGSLLDKLPEEVANGIEELGTMDLYGLIVGSIFFKMAGLLLPIIYVIMTSNNLIASQVDTGSMAYVLSTSTRREEVTFTQSLYLIGSLFLMFVCTTITSIICFEIADVTTDLSCGKLVLINLGAFITLFAISGINFLTSCFFDRSKKAMALGGGISMFFLVATMLGLFGSPVIPSVVRISALNNFNYVSLITLFDVVSILKGEYQWIYKLVILLVVGLISYIVGSIKFKKKDLPL